MYLKIMDAENAPDDDSRKAYRLLSDVVAVKFSRISDIGQGPRIGTFAFVRFKSGEPETFDIPANAYLMNDNGKTISSWASMSLIPTTTGLRPGIESELELVLEELVATPSASKPNNDIISRALDVMKNRDT
jgi:hypothetical protein